MSAGPTNADRLLLVDDDPVLSRMAARTLRHAGYQVATADSGEDALLLFAAGEFDLVLLDVMMPGLDGFEVCERLRRLPRGARVPVLMLTGLNDTESIEAAFRCGATDFVTKPINWALLGHRVRYSLRAAATAEEAVRQSEHLGRAQRLARLGSWELTLASGEIACSDEYLRMIGREGSHRRALTAQLLLNHVSAADRGMVAAARDELARSGRPYHLRFAIEQPDGQRRVVLEQAAAARDGAGQIVRIEVTAQDISEQVENERRIHRLAYYDELTGLGNRQYFVERTQARLAQAPQGARCGAVLHVDIDRFKSVNDALGVAGGNRVLCSLGGRLGATLRRLLPAAEAGAEAGFEFARVGGNAFAILLPELASDADAARLATRVLDALAQPFRAGEQTITLTASAGIALFPRDADNASALLQKAEQAMYAAKSAGRAQLRAYDERTNAAAGERLTRESELRRAIEADELRLHFQPQVDAASGRMVGAEALVRWQHPRRGLVPPGEFIPLAEDSGLVIPLGNWVLQSACSALQRFQAAGLGAVPVSVNLSSSGFMQDELPAQLMAAVARHGIEPRQLTLEITESMLAEDVDLVVERMHQLREMGFGLSLDDFGTGFSSLSYLQRLPIHELKIDRAFVRDAAAGGTEAALAGSIIELGRLFGLHVVAEGVETTEQAEFLLGRGCGVHQGFLYAKALPIDEFEQLLLAGSDLRRRAMA